MKKRALRGRSFANPSKAPSAASLTFVAVLSIFALAGCGEPRPDFDVTHGAAPSVELGENLRPFDFKLPDDITDGEWMQAVDWDTQSVYLRFRTSEAGVAGMLSQCSVAKEDLTPVTSDTSMALPLDTVRADRLPRSIADWAPTSWRDARGVNQRTTCGAKSILVEAGSRPQVFVCLLDF